MALPDVPRDQLIESAIASAKRNNRPLMEFIKNYSDYILGISHELLDEAERMAKEDKQRYATLTDEKARLRAQANSEHKVEVFLTEAVAKLLEEEVYRSLA